ncbi:CRISPR-associated endonuclease Cas1, partial [Thermosulfurimonas dismutans]|uniref:CRISPR-associated endonuclease Cas1 n=1 Tax=Thermosulfurimonas dismutans TaxID=999894 RepID=UPI000A4FD141
MKRPIYIFSNGQLKREGNTLLLITEEEKKVIPVETVEEILVFSELTLNKRLLEFLTQKHIPVHFFNHYG